MRSSILVKDIAPFVMNFFILVGATLLIDYFLHFLKLEWIGRYLGPIGTLLIMLSFSYSLRKKKLIKMGSTKQFLEWHIRLAWLGSLLLLVHAGVHFNALLAWLAVFAMSVDIISGLTGKFLLQRAQQTLKEKEQLLEKSELTNEERERRLFLDSLTVNTLKKWRSVHIPITLLFLLFSLIHIVAVTVMGSYL